MLSELLTIVGVLGLPVVAGLTLFLLTLFGLNLKSNNRFVAGVADLRHANDHAVYGPEAIAGVSKDALLEHATGQVDLNSYQSIHIAPNPVARGNLWARGAKRATDILASLALIFFMLPILVVTAIAIKCESPGTVLYKQTRVGRHGRLFRIYKFRSMSTSAEDNGPQWASQNDTRVTRVGRIIRKTRIDEIPQVINILLGDMSFVGPRPERPEFTRVLSLEIPHYNERHVIKPGLTGWAQVSYQYGASIEDARKKLAYDLYYIKHFNFRFDFVIMLRTVRVALFGVGSR